MDEFNNNFQNTQENQTMGMQPEAAQEVDVQTAGMNQTAEQQDAQSGNTEEPYVQRPSQKYGRTAYQQQMNAQNQNTPNQQYGSSQYEQPYGSNPYNQPNQQYGSSQYEQPYGSNPYNQPNQQYGGSQYQQPYGNGQYQPYGQAYGNAQYQKPHGPVSNIYNYILMVLVGLTIVINLISSKMIFGIVGSMASADYNKMYSEMLAILENNPMYTVLEILSQLIMIATIILFVLDIIKIYRENYKITGLILFAIFLRPAYFIWRAHILGQKKVIPVIYTIAAYGISFFVSFYLCYQMVLDIMSAIM